MARQCKSCEKQLTALDGILCSACLYAVRQANETRQIQANEKKLQRCCRICKKRLTGVNDGILCSVCRDKNKKRRNLGFSG